jgi:hypothetical protein
MNCSVSCILPSTYACGCSAAVPEVDALGSKDDRIRDLIADGCDKIDGLERDGSWDGDAGEGNGSSRRSCRYNERSLDACAIFLVY